MSGSKNQSSFLLDSGFLQFHLHTFWPASDATKLGTSFPCLNSELRTQNSEPSWVTRKCNTPYWLAQRSHARLSLACMRLSHLEYAPHPQVYPPLTWAHWVVGGGGWVMPCINLAQLKLWLLHQQCTAENVTLVSATHSCNCDSRIDSAQLKLWPLHQQCTAATVALALTVHSWKCNSCIDSAQLKPETVTLASTVHSWNFWLLQVNTNEYTMQNIHIIKYCDSCRLRLMSTPCKASTSAVHSWNCDSCIDSAQLNIWLLQLKTDECTMHNFHIDSAQLKLWLLQVKTDEYTMQNLHIASAQLKLCFLQVKTDEYTMHNFHIIKYCHLNHFGSTLGLAGLAVVWQVASQVPYQLHISSTVFKVTNRKEKTAPFHKPLQTYLSRMLYSTNTTSIASALPAPHLRHCLQGDSLWVAENSHVLIIKL